VLFFVNDTLLTGKTPLNLDDKLELRGVRVDSAGNIAAIDEQIYLQFEDILIYKNENAKRTLLANLNRKPGPQTVAFQFTLSEFLPKGALGKSMKYYRKHSRPDDFRYYLEVQNLLLVRSSKPDKPIEVSVRESIMVIELE
jgi:hypothetical protein